MSGAATIFGAGGGMNYGIDSNGNPQQIKSDLGGLHTVLYDALGNALLNDAPGDAIGPGKALSVVSFNEFFNGTGWDRARSSLKTTVFPLAARNANATSAMQRTYNARSLVVLIVITGNPGAAETLTFHLYEQTVPALAFEMSPALVFLAGTDNYGLYQIGPGITENWSDPTITKTSKRSTVLPYEFVVTAIPSVVGAGHDWTFEAISILGV